MQNLSPQSYEKISRAKLLPAIENTRGRDVLCCHPAFANRCAYMHNSGDLVCISLAATNDPINIVPGA